MFARLYVPQLLITGTADAAVLLLPEAAIAGRGGQLLAALVAAGAIAAFLSTSSGLLVSIAGALSTDVLRGRVRDFRIAALVGGLVPLAAVAGGVGRWSCRAPSGWCSPSPRRRCARCWCSGIWWRGLTAVGRGVRAGGRRRRRPAPRRRSTVAGGIDERRARRLARGDGRLSGRGQRAARVRRP